MTESKLHKLVKNGVAQALLQDGFNVKTEYRGIKDEGRIDVYAEKPDGELVKVEVVKTHIPNWLLIRLTGKEKTDPKNRRTTISISYDLLREIKSLRIPSDRSIDDILRRPLKNAKLSKTTLQETTS